MPHTHAARQAVRGDLAARDRPVVDSERDSGLSAASVASGSTASMARSASRGAAATAAGARSSPRRCAPTLHHEWDKLIESGTSELKSGNYSKAEQQFLMAVEIAKKHYLNKSRLATSLTNLAEVDFCRRKSRYGLLQPLSQIRPCSRN